MNKNIVIVLVGAVLVAVLVAALVQVTLGGKDAGPAVIEEAKVQILVADRNLGIGRELQPGDTRWQDWPESSLFPGALIREDGISADEALEGRLARNIAEGEPIMNSALLGQTKGNLVAASLEPGQRAIAIEVNASSMVGGFIGPGDFVDVILTYRDSVRTEDDNPEVQKMIALNLDKIATETILQNVKVLAVDQLAQRPEDDKIKVGKTVTLAVGAQDAERLSLARELGELNLVLRGVGDNAAFEKKWPTVSDSRLTSVRDEIFKEYDKMQEEAGVNRNIVRIYSGEQVTTIPAR